MMDDAFKGPIFRFVTEHLIEICVLFVVTLLVNFYLKNRRLPPGPIGLPIVGYRPFLGDQPQKKLLELRKKYGNVISLRFGPILVVTLNEYNVYKEVMSRTTNLRRNEHAFDHIGDLGFGVKDGDVWEEQRRFCIHSMRDLGLGRGSWENQIQEEVVHFVNNLKLHKGQPIDLKDTLTTEISNNVLSLFLGKKLKNGVNDKEIKHGIEFLDKSMNFMPAYSVLGMIPSLRRFFERNKLAGYHHLANAMQNFRNFLMSEIANHKSSEEYKGLTDFINLYLEKKENLSLQNTKHHFSDDMLIGNLKILYLGAVDTTAASVGWLYHLMALYPDIQKKVQHEIDEILGRDGRIAYEDRFKLPYTLAVMMEEQRYVSTAPLPFRQAGEDCQVEGRTIPKGTMILGNIYAIHNDPNYWKEPEKFIPERFLSEDGKKVLTNLPSYTPFSLGRRMCPGETIAWMEILNYFTAVMQTFDISSPPGIKMNTEAQHGVISKLKSEPLCFKERIHP